MGEVGDRTQGFRRMAARNKPAGIRSLVYGMGKGKVRIEGLSVSERSSADSKVPVRPQKVVYFFFSRIDLSPYEIP